MSGASDFSLLAGPFLPPNGRISVLMVQGDGKAGC